VSHMEFLRIIHALLHRNELLTRAPLNHILSGIHLIIPTNVFFEVKFNIMFHKKRATFLQVFCLGFRVPSHSLILLSSNNIWVISTGSESKTSSASVFTGVPNLAHHCVHKIELVVETCMWRLLLLFTLAKFSLVSNKYSLPPL
jgi:hypothetical protein